MRRCHIVGTFYRRTAKPKRGDFRFVASTLLRRTFGARSAHTNPTNGIAPVRSCTAHQDPGDLQVQRSDPVPVGPLCVFLQPHLPHLLADGGSVDVAKNSQAGQDLPPSVAPGQLGHCRVDLRCGVIQPRPGDQDACPRSPSPRGQSLPLHDAAHLATQAGLAELGAPFGPVPHQAIDVLHHAQRPPMATQHRKAQPTTNPTQKKLNEFNGFSRAVVSVLGVVTFSGFAWELFCSLDTPRKKARVRARDAKPTTPNTDSRCPAKIAAFRCGAPLRAPRHKPNTPTSSTVIVMRQAP